MLFHLEVSQRLGETETIKKIDNVTGHAIFLAENVVYLVDIV